MKRQGNEMKKLLSMFLACGLLTSSMFSMSVQAEESVQEPIRIEFENYLTGDMSSYASDDASLGAAAGFYTYNEQSIMIPVTITESGYYDLSYVAGYYNGSSYVSKINFNLYLKSRFPLPCNNYDTPSTELSYDTTWGHQKIHLFERPSIWIDANEYYLEAQVGITPDKQYKGFLDYFEFKPSGRAKIQAGAPSRIEFDEYSYQGVYDWDRGVTANENASGKALVLQEWLSGDFGNPGTIISIPVNVEKAGYYHINYVTGLYSGQSWLSLLEFKLDDVLLGTNKDTVSESLIYEAWDSQEVGLYEKQWIWLPSGDHELKVDVTKAPTGNVYKYQVDYIEFIPATNGITLDDGTIKVHAAYFENKTGRVIMAAYNGSDLVGCLSYDVQDAEYANFEYTPDEDVTKVKVFLWNASNNIQPIEIEREFMLSE